MSASWEEMYRSYWTDLRIATEAGVSVAVVKRWRERKGLPARDRLQDTNAVPRRYVKVDSPLLPHSSTIQYQILWLIHRSKPLRAVEIAACLYMGEGAVRGHLHILKRKGLLALLRNGQFIEWEVTDTAAALLGAEPQDGPEPSWRART